MQGIYIFTEEDKQVVPLLSPFRRAILIGCAVLLGSVVTWRFVQLLSGAFLVAPSTDFNAYYVVSRALLQGQPLYDLQSYQQGLELVPIVSPPQAVAFFPLSILPYEVSFYVFLFLNIASICCLMMLCFGRLARETGGQEAPLATLIATFLLFNMPAVTNAVWVGQLSGIVVLLIIGALLFQNLLLRSLCLAVGVALKLSFLPLAALVLFTEDRWRTLFLATILFGVLCCIPWLFGNPLWLTYQAYGEAVSLMMQEWNSFVRDGAANRIDIGFLKSQLTTLFLQALCVAMVFVVLIKNKGRKRLDVSQLFFVVVLTMTMSYHRIYDMVLPLVLLLLCAYLFVIERKWWQVAICGIFLSFYLIPYRLVLAGANTLGRLVGQNDFVFIGARTYVEPPLLTLFPIPAIVTTLLTLYAGYLYFSMSAYHNCQFLYRKDSR